MSILGNLAVIFAFGLVITGISLLGMMEANQVSKKTQAKLRKRLEN